MSEIEPRNVEVSTGNNGGIVDVNFAGFRRLTCFANVLSHLVFDLLGFGANLMISGPTLV